MLRLKIMLKSIKLIKTHKNVLVTRTFSKMYGLAGLRIGYGVANAELIDLLNRIREPFNVNSLAQAAAVAVLKDKSYYRGLARKISTQRKYLYQSLDRMNLEYVKSFTNFILINIGPRASATAKKLMKKGVIIRNMSFWGLNNYIRVSIGTASENRRFIRTLKEIL